MCNLRQVIGSCGHVITTSALPCQKRAAYGGCGSHTLSPILCPACAANAEEARYGFPYPRYQPNLPITYGALIQGPAIPSSQPFYGLFYPAQQIRQSSFNPPPFPPASAAHQPYYPTPRQQLPPFTPSGLTPRPPFTTLALYHLGTRTTIPLPYDVPLGVLPPPGFLHAAIPAVPLYPQKIPGPGPNGALLPVPEGAIAEIRDGVTHYTLPDNEKGSGCVQQQGYNPYHGYDAGALPPGWGVDAPFEIGGGEEVEEAATGGQAEEDATSSTTLNPGIEAATRHAAVSWPSETTLVSEPSSAVAEPSTSPEISTPNTQRDTDIEGSRAEGGREGESNTHSDSEIKAARVVRFASTNGASDAPALA